jgi:SAM-dependent methyltransferase
MHRRPNATVIMKGSTKPQCPLCGTGRMAPLFRKHQTDYWQCSDCRFRFGTPAVNPNLVRTLGDYEDAYLQYLAPDPSDGANLHALCQWMEGFARLQGRRLLDVGAGSGKLVRYLRSRGVDAHGIEPSTALYERFLAGDPAFTYAMLDQFNASAARPFEIVTAFDVIEHVADPAAFLREIGAALEPGGVVFVSTPDVESPAARLLGRWWHFYHPSHLSYFTPHTLARAAAHERLSLLDCRHRGRLRSVSYIVRYFAEFVGGVRAPGWVRRFDTWYLPVNLFDTMYVAFRRHPGQGVH